MYFLANVNKNVDRYTDDADIDTRMTQIGLMNTDFYRYTDDADIDTRMTQIGLMNTDFY